MNSPIEFVVNSVFKTDEKLLSLADSIVSSVTESVFEEFRMKIRDDLFEAVPLPELHMHVGYMMYRSLSDIHRLDLDLRDDTTMLRRVNPSRQFTISRSLTPDAYKARVFLYLARGRFRPLLADLKNYVNLPKEENAPILITSTEVNFLDRITSQRSGTPIESRKQLMFEVERHPFHKIALEYCAPADPYSFDFMNGFSDFSSCEFDERFVFIRTLDKFHKELRTFGLIDEVLSLKYVDSMLATLVYTFIGNKEQAFVSDEEVKKLLQSLGEVDYARMYPHSSIIDILWTCDNTIIASEARAEFSNSSVVREAFVWSKYLGLHQRMNLAHELGFSMVTEKMFCDWCIQSMYQVDATTGQFNHPSDVENLVTFVTIEHSDRFPWQSSTKVQAVLSVHKTLLDQLGTYDDASGLIQRLVDQYYV